MRFVHHKAYTDEFDDAGKHVARHFYSPEVLFNAEAKALVRAAFDQRAMPRRRVVELTAIGEQYVIEGCERRHDVAKPVQLGLWE